MVHNQSNQKIKVGNSIIILLSIVGLIACIAVLFPQVRQMIMNLLEQMRGRKLNEYQSWFEVLASYAMGGICLILFFDYCTLIHSGRMLVQNVKQEIYDCLSEIDFHSFRKPVLLLAGVYLLGILTIVRANFLYNDDNEWAVFGSRSWYDWSRYVTVLLSYFLQPEIHLTDISPLPQLLAAVTLSCSSVLLVYILGEGKMTIVRLLASISLGLFPYMLEGLSYKFPTFYGALSILISILPFLFITRKKAFFFCSVVFLLIECMFNQSAVNIYMLIVIMLCFRDWNSRKKTQKEILYFLGTSAVAFCFALLFFKFFLMRPINEQESYYTSNAILPMAHLVSGILSNIKNYAIIINHDLGLIWKAGIVLILFFFIVQSMRRSAYGKIKSLFVSILVIGLSFCSSYGLYSLMATPLYEPRSLFGFGIFVAILCIIVVLDYKKVAIITVLALNWCFFIFAFSYGNALADQKRYIEFRRGILLHDLDILYSHRENNSEFLTFQFKNSIDFAPSIHNIAKNYPLIERLVPKQLTRTPSWEYLYFPDYMKMDYESGHLVNKGYLDFSSLNLPVVLDSYYHTIQSDGSHVLIIFKH